MAQPSNDFKIAKGFFHSLSKVHTQATQYVFESLYKSGHTVQSKDVWSEVVDYAINSVDADDFAASNPDICLKFTQQSLTEIPGSNGQAWYLNSGGSFIRNWISPVDVPNPTTNQPSHGYQAILYKSDNSLISPTLGIWVIDYYAGIVMFQEGYTPFVQGYGTPKITCYQYIGKNLASPVNLEDLNNVSSVQATNGQFLMFNGTLNKWEPTSNVDGGELTGGDVWLDYTNNTYWEIIPEGTSSWVTDHWLGGCCFDVHIQPIGGWQVGFRPSKIRLTVGGYISEATQFVRIMDSSFNPQVEFDNTEFFTIGNPGRIENARPNLQVFTFDISLTEDITRLLVGGTNFNEWELHKIEFQELGG